MRLRKRPATSSVPRSPESATEPPGTAVPPSLGTETPANLVTGLITVLVGGYGVLLGHVWGSPDVGLLFKLGLSLGYLAGLVLLFIVRVRLKAVERREVEKELEDKVRRRGTILAVMTREVTECLGLIRELFVKGSDELGSEEVRRESVERVLQGLCNVFASDPAVDWSEPPYFKATLFVEDPSIGDSGGLRRTYWHYPPARGRPQTDTWDFDRQPNAAAVICFNTSRAVMIRNISNERERWVDGRPNQRHDYEGASMLCVRVWGEVEGVVTVDTSWTDYFLETRGGQQFIDQLVGPFIGAIRLAYAVTGPTIGGGPDPRAER